MVTAGVTTAVIITVVDIAAGTATIDLKRTCTLTA